MNVKLLIQQNWVSHIVKNGLINNVKPKNVVFLLFHVIPIVKNQPIVGICVVQKMIMVDVNVGINLLHQSLNMNIRQLFVIMYQIMVHVYIGLKKNLMNTIIIFVNMKNILVQNLSQNEAYCKCWFGHILIVKKNLKLQHVNVKMKIMKNDQQQFCFKMGLL